MAAFLKHPHSCKGESPAMGSPEAQTIGPGVMSVGEPRIPAPCVTLGSIPTPLCFLVIFRQMSCECPCLEPGEAYRDNERKRPLSLARSGRQDTFGFLLVLIKPYMHGCVHIN